MQEPLSSDEILLFASLTIIPAALAVLRLLSRYRDGEFTKGQLRLWLVILIFAPMVGGVIYLLTDLRIQIGRGGRRFLGF